MEIQNIVQNLSDSLIPWLFSHGIKIVIILIAAFFIGRIGEVFTEKIIRKAIKDSDEKAEKKRENTLIQVFGGTIDLTIWLMAALTILPEFGINIAPILAGAGLLGLAIGMGAKNVINDFLVGVFIILEDQYRVGDSVKIAGIEGTVKDINLRRTILKDSEGTEHLISNGQIKIISNKSKAVN